MGVAGVSFEMAGEDVFLLHRLLKNGVTASEYMLLTESFHHLLGDLPEARGELHEEVYEDLGPVRSRVLFPRVA